MWISCDDNCQCYTKGHAISLLRASHLTTQKPPHWDYLVICSPNFYEVAFPFDFCSIVFFFMLYVVTILGVVAQFAQTSFLK